MKTLLLFILLPLFSVSNAQLITTFAGNGTVGFSGDGNPAITAQLNGANGIGFDNAGNMYIADVSNNRIRKINTSGIVTTFAGMGLAFYAGDGGPATAAALNQPMGIAVDSIGAVYIADALNSRIRKVDTFGIITTVAGNGLPGYSGDNGPATAAQLSAPNALAIDHNGNVFFSENGVRIRKINTSGIITTIAGTGTAGFSGDGALATAAQVCNPYGMAFDAAGNLYFADNCNQRIRKINTTGIISTVAGTGTAAFSGDGGPATAAALNYLWGIAIDAYGNIIFSDANNHRIRKITPSGIINTIAGMGTMGYSGDGGPALSAQLNRPTGLCLDIAGNIYFSDVLNARIRKLTVATTSQTIVGDYSNEVYPNPAHDFIMITSAETEIHVVIADPVGRVIRTENAGGNTLRLNLSDLPAGLYYLRINESVQKIIKQ